MSDQEDKKTGPPAVRRAPARDEQPVPEMADGKIRVPLNQPEIARLRALSQEAQEALLAVGDAEIEAMRLQVQIDELLRAQADSRRRKDESAKMAIDKRDRLNQFVEMRLQAAGYQATGMINIDLDHGFIFVQQAPSQAALAPATVGEAKP